MKAPSLITFLFIFSATLLNSQTIDLYPEIGITPEFGEKVSSEFIERDRLLENWDNLSEPEQERLNFLLEMYPETVADEWDIVGGGCSWYCGGGPDTVTASSFLASQGSNKYFPNFAHDLNYKSAWVEGVKGYGVGQYLEYRFNNESPRINTIIVVNGYVKSDKAWTENSRVKSLKVSINDQPYAILHLEDSKAKQIFETELLGRLESGEEMTLKFEILEVYKGSKYDDTVISEIFFDGIDVH